MLKSIIRQSAIFFGLISRPEFCIKYTSVQPDPTSVGPNDLILVGDRNHPKWACFHCPGSCEVFLRLPLGAKQNPRWLISTDWLGRPSAHPSIHQKNACHAHFWLKNGDISWCIDSGCANSSD